MSTINELKQQIVTDTPLLLFECQLPTGDIQRWASHEIFTGGRYFESRVLRHDLFDLQLSADDAIDGVSQLTLVLANADSALSEISAQIGFKGSQLTVFFAFADLASMKTTTEETILFRGIGGDPDEVTEDSLTISFLNKLNLQRIPLPEVRIQRTCSWNFPSSDAQRQEATGNGPKGTFSPFYRCGYSPDVAGGNGTLDPRGNAYTSCDKSRAHCEKRGMFNIDQFSRITRRFSGFEFVPSAINVRTAGDKSTHLSAVLSNSAKYNDPVPLVYGTSWLKAPIIFARNDGNLTHMEVLLGMGQISGVLKVIVNDVEIPLATTSQDMTSTGWYGIYTSGSRLGNFNQSFLDNSGNPLGDPYGSMAAMSVVVPNRISTGSSLPVVQVLLQGVTLDVFDENGVQVSNSFSNNPAWIVLDILRRCGWSLSELDLPSFSRSAQYCGELISASDVNGNPQRVQRFQCNLAITKRQSAATIVRGIRVASSLMLRYGVNGLLELFPETTIGQQQPVAPDGTNSLTEHSEGWPAYEFSDDSADFSGIVRAESGASTVRLLSRNMAELSNRLSVEFQDEENEFQQDSLSVVDSSDSALVGYEIASQSTALGLANYNQATRVLLRQLDRSLKGNLFIEFQTSFRALKIRPGDIISFTYLKEGLQRCLFRVVKLSPAMNYQLVNVTAQIHNDEWYSDDISVLSGAGRQPLSAVQTPRPLIGSVPELGSQGQIEGFTFSVSEEVQALPDGTASDLLTVTFAQPSKPNPNAPRVPLVNLAPDIQVDGGELEGERTYYYAVSASDMNGQEGPLSFTIKATIDGSGRTYAVRLKNLSFPSNAVKFNVYRGSSPQLLHRIATEIPVSASFIDSGASPQPAGPPDASFDHANFYYRYELVSGSRVSSASVNTIECSSLGATIGAYNGMAVRIISGTGKGQERSIATNSTTKLTLTSPWSVVPDESSTFVICESSWRFGAVTAVNPAQFSVPYRSKTVLQITGRAANVHNQEGSPEICPTVRVPLGQSKPDFGVPAIPTFSLSTPGSGQIALSEIGFTSDNNIASISSGTLNLYYQNEIDGATSRLAAGMDTVTSTLQATSDLGTPGGNFIQIGREIMYVLGKVAFLPNSYVVLRGQLGSAASAWETNASITPLNNSKVVIPFAANFFQNAASINLIHTFSLPDVRVAAAQFFVENGFGTSQTSMKCFTTNSTTGLRTLSGGQLNIQLGGFVTNQSNAAPPLLVQATHAVRDIRATLGQPSAGLDTRIDVLQDGTPFCSLLIAAGEAASTLLDGLSVGPLRKEATLTTNVWTSPSSNVSAMRPAKDLTITIRM